MSTLLLSTRRKIAIARLARTFVVGARRLVGQTTEGVFKRRSLKWALDLNEGIDLSIYLFGSFEPELLECYTKLVRPGSTVLDLGANIGAHTLPLARQVGPQGKVVAVEATAYAFDKLQKNIALNPELGARVHARHAMLVDNEATYTAPAALHSSWPLAGQAATHPTHGGQLKPLGTAHITSVDAIVTDLQLAAVDWIKIDVDGHELSVLRGATRVLQQYRPRIMMELAPHCYDNQPGSFAALLELLWSNGYGFFLPDKPEPLVNNLTQIHALIPAGGSINVLARPK